MVSKCANPSCNATFRFMHAGRVFRFDFPVDNPDISHQDILWDANGLPRKTELFWLCDDCARIFTLVKAAHGSVKIEALAASTREEY